MRRSRGLVGAAMLLALTLFPAPSDAKHKGRGGVSECQQRIANKISADHPPSRGVSFDSDAQRSSAGKNAVTISGWGRVRTAKNKRRGFSYRCVYNTSSGKLSKVNYSID